MSRPYIKYLEKFATTEQLKELAYDIVSDSDVVDYFISDYMYSLGVYGVFEMFSEYLESIDIDIKDVIVEYLNDKDLLEYASEQVITEYEKNEKPTKSMDVSDFPF